MERLNLPEYPFIVQGVAEARMIYDSIRGKYVRLTPEEWVRQHLIRFLVHERGFPRGLISIEAGFVYQGMQRRADVVVYDRQGKPLLLVECKAPEVEITQNVFDQAARYNRVIQARYLVVTNGLTHFCSRIDWESRTYAFLDELPNFEELLNDSGSNPA